MHYSHVVEAIFLERNNRFVATCQLGKEIFQVHVKNTGRCKELLIQGVKVALSYQPKSTRKTDYDLVAVMKNHEWLNIDSQIPNDLVYQGITERTILLPHVNGNYTKIKREQKFGNSKFDLYLETDQSEKIFIEVKGMTLEKNGIGAFPDAPSLRALKHVAELEVAASQGYQTYILFVAQFAQIEEATIYEKMQPKLQVAIESAMENKTQVLAYNCEVTSDAIFLHKQIPFSTKTSFFI